MNNDVKVLDCTLRDGGYVNEWKWGYYNARTIIGLLAKAEIDFVEVGFLKNVNEYKEDVTVCDSIEELNRLIPENNYSTRYSAMAMQSDYDIDKLSPYLGEGIELIRITAHDYDIEAGMNFAEAVQEKGYKLSINPINIMGYSDEKILWIIERVNKIHPYQFTIVDTFGSMKRRDLDRIVSLIDNNLLKDIRLGLHLHENMSLSFCLAQNFIDKHLNRPVSIDGSLMGIGRTPGNLPIELLADYCNEYVDKSYDIDYLLDAINDFIIGIKGETKWGYTPAYFLSARYNVHRNYAEHYIGKGDLSNRDIANILASFDVNKSTAFDLAYADNMYYQYKDNDINDSYTLNKLQREFSNQPILVLAPGNSIELQYEEINAFICSNKPIIISLNFVPERFSSDFAFFSNSRRFSQSGDVFCCKLILTSNISAVAGAYIVNYNSLVSSCDSGYNSLVMLLKLLCNIGVDKVFVAGADGYVAGKRNYYKSSITMMNVSNAKDQNDSIKKSISRLGINVIYLTESAYR